MCKRRIIIIKTIISLLLLYRFTINIIFIYFSWVSKMSEWVFLLLASNIISTKVAVHVTNSFQQQMFGFSVKIVFHDCKYENQNQKILHCSWSLGRVSLSPCELFVVVCGRCLCLLLATQTLWRHTLIQQVKKTTRKWHNKTTETAEEQTSSGPPRRRTSVASVGQSGDRDGFKNHNYSQRHSVVV